MSVFVQQNNTINNFLANESWVILSPIEKSIKQKIEAIGTPLKDWDINIYRGVLTGCNEAFIISTEKRNEILDNCKDDEERKRTEDIIRPILRGRDIKRYKYDWANLWLINIHNGIKGKLPRIYIEDYPAIKKHLDIYWDKISIRSDKGDTPYNLRNCAYMDLFFQPKICWKSVGRNLAFSIVDAGIFLTAPASFISAGNYNNYITLFLCSDICRYYVYKNSDTTGAGDIMLNIQSLIKIPIPKLNEQQLSLFYNKYNNFKIDNIKIINQYLYNIYEFSEKEIKYIQHIVNNK